MTCGLFFCLTFQLACCCGTAACALCCKCCPKIKQSTSTRFMYALYFILVTIICCVMMSTTVANEMKTHVSKRDEPADTLGRKWDPFHSSSRIGVPVPSKEVIDSLSLSTLESKQDNFPCLPSSCQLLTPGVCFTTGRVRDHRAHSLPPLPLCGNPLI